MLGGTGPWGGPGGGMGGFGGLGGVGGGGFGAGMGGFGAAPPAMPDGLVQFEVTAERIALGLISARVRTRALIELLEDKGVLGREDFDGHAAKVWDRDYDALATELLAPPEEDPAPPPSPEGRTSVLDAPLPAQATVGYYRERLLNFVDASVAGRVRLRALIELLEARAIFQPGDFDRKAEEIWDRDYEELSAEFHKGNY